MHSVEGSATYTPTRLDQESRARLWLVCGQARAGRVENQRKESFADAGVAREENDVDFLRNSRLICGRTSSQTVGLLLALPASGLSVQFYPDR